MLLVVVDASLDQPVHGFRSSCSRENIGPRTSKHDLACFGGAWRARQAKAACLQISSRYDQYSSPRANRGSHLLLVSPGGTNLVYELARAQHLELATSFENSSLRSHPPLHRSCSDSILDCLQPISLALPRMCCGILVRCNADLSHCLPQRHGSQTGTCAHPPEAAPTIAAAGEAAGERFGQ